MFHWDGNIIANTTARVILGGADMDPNPAPDAFSMFGTTVTAETDPEAWLLVEGNLMPYSDLRLILAGDAPAGGPYMLGGAVVLPAEGQDQ